MASRPARLFVYGTLQDGGRLDALIGNATRWRVLARGTTAGALYDVGRYPAMIRVVTEQGARRRSPRAADRVPGLVIELAEPAAALRVLDKYEGVDDGVYARRRCRVLTADGVTTTAWVYVYSRPVTGLRRIAAWPYG